MIKTQLKEQLKEKKRLLKSAYKNGEISLNELLEEYVEEKNNSYLRLAAEFENYKKRTSKEKLDLTNITKVKMIDSILDMDSDLSIAISKVKNKEAKDGIQLISSKLKNFLKSQDIKSIQTDTYDSEIHEVVTMIDTGESKIIDVVSKGYTLGGKVIRYPKIILGK